MIQLKLFKICIESLKFLSQFHMGRIAEISSMDIWQKTASHLPLVSVLKLLNVVWSVALIGYARKTFTKIPLLSVLWEISHLNVSITKYRNIHDTR